MGQNHKIVLQASASKAAATYTYPVTNNDNVGLLLLVDVTSTGAAGTLDVGITVKEDAGNTAQIWTATQLVAANSATAVNAYYIYPQGLDTKAGQYTGTSRTSLSLPNSYNVVFVVQANAVVFSATAYLLD